MKNRHFSQPVFTNMLFTTPPTYQATSQMPPTDPHISPSNPPHPPHTDFRFHSPALRSGSDCWHSYAAAPPIPSRPSYPPGQHSRPPPFSVGTPAGCGFPAAPSSCRSPPFPPATP